MQNLRKSVCSTWLLKRSNYLCYHHQNLLNYSRQSQPERKGFFGNFFDNIKQDIAKNREMKENIKKFREEAQKLEESDALKKAREKFDTIESETNKGSQQIKEQLDMIKEKLNKTLEEAQKTELGKKSIEVTEELAKSAKMAAEAIAKQSENLGKNTAFKAVSQSVKAIKEEVDEVGVSGSNVYKAPLKLRKRSENSSTLSDKVFEPNTEATGILLHKDSRWYQSWQNFKDNNQYVNKIFDWKNKFDESDNPVVRASRLLTDKVTDLFGNLFQSTELSEVLTEICRVDPNFEKGHFLRECEVDIIPNILEAMIRGDIEILKDWCYEAVYSNLSSPIIKAQGMGLHFDSKVLDIGNVDLAMGKIMEQGPVLIITFQSQQILCVRDSKGNIFEGDPNQIVRIHYVWVLCRDQNELDPKAAWRLLDISANSSTQWL